MARYKKETFFIVYLSSILLISARIFAYDEKTDEYYQQNAVLIGEIGKSYDKTGGNNMEKELYGTEISGQRPT